MSELNKNWMPEIGAKCKFTWGAKVDYLTCFYHGRTQNGLYIVEFEDGQITSSKYYDDIEFRPIKSEAEKLREEQTEAISQTLYTQGISLRYISRRTAAEALYNTGCRMTYKLTAGDIAELYRKHLVTNDPCIVHDFARAIEAHILGETNE